CKGCKAQCPVKVDMASYKAEVLSHYYDHHRRPLAAQAFGHIDRWSRWASHAPGLANVLTQTPALAALARRAIGIAPQRRLPPFARRSFRRGFREAPRRPGTSDVLLW